MKNKKNIRTDEDSEQEDVGYISQIVVGDLAVSSKSGLPACRKTIKGLLRDKTIKNYLGVYDRKKMLESPSYID